MIIPKKDRVLISKFLFAEGVLVAKKDTEAPKHALLNTRNLYVMKLMQSYKSKGYVKETFSWQWYYYYLTEEGVKYLREYLGLSQQIVPNTQKRVTRARPQGDRRPGGFRGNRDDKKSGAPSDFKPSTDGGRPPRGDGPRPRAVGRGAGATPTPSE